MKKALNVSSRDSQDISSPLAFAEGLLFFFKIFY
jgi:hypothetical protein